MKLLSFRRPDGIASWGILKNEGVIDLGGRTPGLKHALWATTSLAEEAARHANFKLQDLTLLPPVPDPEKILCVGLNYYTYPTSRKAGASRHPSRSSSRAIRTLKSATARRWCGRRRPRRSITRGNWR